MCVQMFSALPEYQQGHLQVFPGIQGKQAHNIHTLLLFYFKNAEDRVRLSLL